MSLASLRIDYIADWAARLVTRLYEQFKGKPKLLAIVEDVIAPQVQELEEATQLATTLRSIDDSEGWQLDLLGGLIGQLRAGATDALYRFYLRGRVLANRSRGTTEDLVSVLRAVLGSATSIAFVDEWPAGAHIEAVYTTSAAIAAAILDLLTDAHAAGVRLIYIWREQAVAETFFTAVGTCLTADTTDAETTLSVVDTSMLPATGTVTVNPNGDDPTTDTYTVVDGVTIELTSGLSVGHPAGTFVELSGDDGLGFADDPLTTVTAPASIGDTALTVADTTGAPASGFIIIEPDAVNRERVAYSALAADEFTVAPLTLAHAAGSLVYVDDGTAGAFASAQVCGEIDA